MKKDIVIGDKLNRVFVLKESDNRVVYIPIKALTKVDYDRLNAISEASSGEMMEEMKKTTLDNGRNALALYDFIIQVAEKKSDTQAERILKSEEVQRNVELAKDSAKNEEDAIGLLAKALGGLVNGNKTIESSDAIVEEQKPVQKRTRRKPGPKPKAQQ